MNEERGAGLAAGFSDHGEGAGAECGQDGEFAGAGRYGCTTSAIGGKVQYAQRTMRRGAVISWAAKKPAQTGAIRPK